jgi:hypothetical protein
MDSWDPFALPSTTRSNGHIAKVGLPITQGRWASVLLGKLFEPSVSGGIFEVLTCMMLITRHLVTDRSNEVRWKPTPKGVLCFSGAAVSLALARERHGEARKLLAIGTNPMARNPAQDLGPSDVLKATRKNKLCADR